MRHPFWIVNSTLFLLVLVTLGFVYFSRVQLPVREDIEPELYTRIKQDQAMAIPIAIIYENDLFGSYKKVVPQEPKDEIAPLPEPPVPQQPVIPEVPTPQFLDPLNVTLKGIIAFSSGDSKNTAIIEDNKVNKELSYKVGDTIEDAQIIRILNNKVVLLRSNGQQEVLYLREQDAKLDPAFLLIEDWQKVVEKIGATTYLIDPQEFLLRIKDVAYFIDLIGLTTAYKQGRSIGVMVGPVVEKTLASALGLMTGDIILTVNNIPATSTDNRMRIYQDVISAKAGDTIQMNLLRKKQEITLSYVLKEFAQEAKKEEKIGQKQQLEKIKEEEKINILKKKHRFAPTVQEIRNREREQMLNYGKASMAR